MNGEEIENLICILQEAAVSHRIQNDPFERDFTTRFGAFEFSPIQLISCLSFASDHTKREDSHSFLFHGGRVRSDHRVTCKVHKFTSNKPSAHQTKHRRVASLFLSASPLLIVSDFRIIYSSYIKKRQEERSPVRPIRNNFSNFKLNHREHSNNSSFPLRSTQCHDKKHCNFMSSQSLMTQNK